MSKAKAPLSFNNLRQKIKSAYENKITYLFEDEYEELKKCNKNEFKVASDDHFLEELAQYSYTEFLKKKIDENRKKIKLLKENRNGETLKIGPNLEYYRRFI